VPIESGVVVRPDCDAAADGSAVVTIVRRHVWRRSERQRRDPTISQRSWLEHLISMHGYLAILGSHRSSLFARP
jgi:hypothetical protein